MSGEFRCVAGGRLGCAGFREEDTGWACDFYLEVSLVLNLWGEEASTSILRLWYERSGPFDFRYGSQN